MRSASGHATVAETHLIRSIGSQSQSYTEEHWSSEITSFVALAPPKFIQVIKAYRVLASDTISLVVEVASDPPAIFEWFCNEKSVLQVILSNLELNLLTATFRIAPVSKSAMASTSVGLKSVNLNQESTNVSQGTRLE